jgi:hypothetical protein
LKALNHLANCSDHLANGTISSISDKSQPSEIITRPVDEDAAVFRLWFPLLLGLSTAVGDSRISVRVRALDTLGSVLRKHGSIFSPQAWGVIFKGILFPMIDSAKTDFTPQPFSQWPTQNLSVSNNRQSWIGTMAVSVFNICIELFKEFEDKASPVLLLPDLMKLIEDCVCQDVESLARTAVRVYNDLIISFNKRVENLSSSLDNDRASLICTRVCGCIKQSLCLNFGDLGFMDYAEDTPIEISESLIDCPVNARRIFKDESYTRRNTHDGHCRTPFGGGIVDTVR